MAESLSKSVPEIVRLDASALNEAKSVLYQAYRHEPTFQYLFDADRTGYEKRIRATIRELINLYLDLKQDAIGVLLDETLVGVAFIGSPDLRLDLANQLSWRLRMILTAGLSCTRRYIEYHEQIKRVLPEKQVHQLPLMGVHPKYQNRGMGRLLLEAVEKMCEENPRTGGLVLDTGNSRYLEFYRSMGFHEVGEVHLGNVTEHVLLKEFAG
ncbi:GNAT family N-acetyltransferase [Marinobacteraceae bacterium S3BR75-40.1]